MCTLYTHDASLALGFIDPFSPTQLKLKFIVQSTRPLPRPVSFSLE